LREPNHRAANTEVNYIYDRNRLARIDYPSKQDVVFSYGAPGAANGRAGRLAMVEDETGSVEYFYGAFGEARKLVHRLNRHTAAQSPAIFIEEQTFDSMGRLLEKVYPDGERLAHFYDAGGN